MNLNTYLHITMNTSKQRPLMEMDYRYLEYMLVSFKKIFKQTNDRLAHEMIVMLQDELKARE